MIHALALIAAAAPFPYCLRVEDQIDTATVYRVLPGDRAIFYRTPDCSDAGCSERAYVVPGDRVILYSPPGRRRCAYFARTRETEGWLDSDRLAPDATALHPPISAWIGDWFDHDDHIRLTSAGTDRLRIEGDAYYPSAQAESPNFGNLDGVATRKGDRLDYSDGPDPIDCRATLRLLGDYLLVLDNANCGGQNVRFRGVYRRRSAHKPATRS